MSTDFLSMVMYMYMVYAMGEQANEHVFVFVVQEKCIETLLHSVTSAH